MPDEKPCGCGCVNTFSSKEAEQDLRRYRENGPDRTTRALVNAIRARGIDGATLLDVGGGIGAIQWELLADGVASSQSVDASEGYAETVRREAARRGLAERVTVRLGTLETLADEVQPADVVTLDRVICCDPDMEALLAVVTAKAGRIVGLVYPRVTWWNRLAERVFTLWSWITRDETRWHLHPEVDIDFILRFAGFERRFIDRTFVWRIAVYERRPIPTGD
jgi:hypothetical protein